MSMDIRDLADFYKKWPELRTTAIKIKNKGCLQDDDRNLMNWIILMLDRVGPADFTPQQEEAKDE